MCVCVCVVSRYPDNLIRFSCLDFPCWLSSIFQLSVSCFNAYTIRHWCESFGYYAIRGFDHVERETAGKSNAAEYPQVLPAVEVRQCWQNNESWSITTETAKTFQIRLTSHLHINPTCHQAVSLLLDINWYPETAPEPRRFHLIAQPVWFMFFQTLFGFDTFLFSHLTADWRSVPRERCAGWEVWAFLQNDGIG